MMLGEAKLTGRKGLFERVQVQALRQWTSAQDVCHRRFPQTGRLIPFDGAE